MLRLQPQHAIFCSPTRCPSVSWNGVDAAMGCWLVGHCATVTNVPPWSSLAPSCWSRSHNASVPWLAELVYSSPFRLVSVTA
jgi:hypothetical protein